FQVTAPTHTHTPSLHDALPISSTARSVPPGPEERGSRNSLTSPSTRTTGCSPARTGKAPGSPPGRAPCSAPCSAPWSAKGSPGRSEEHTSELQSRFDLVCRLLL